MWIVVEGWVKNKIGLFIYLSGKYLLLVIVVRVVNMFFVELKINNYGYSWV